MCNCIFRKINLRISTEFHVKIPEYEHIIYRIILCKCDLYLICVSSVKTIFYQKVLYEYEHIFTRESSENVKVYFIGESSKNLMVYLTKNPLRTWIPQSSVNVKAYIFFNNHLRKWSFILSENHLWRCILAKNLCMPRCKLSIIWECEGVFYRSIISEFERVSENHLRM